MAIWMDDIETKASTSWRRSDIALVASLAVIVTLQFAVALYVFDFSSTAKAAVSVDTPATATVPLSETWATRFSTQPVNPQFYGQEASAGPTLWFNQGTAEARVSFASAGQPLYAPESYAFTTGAMRVSLGEVPTDYRDTTNISPPATWVATGTTAVAAFAPDRTTLQIRAKSGGAFQNIAALRSYLGESGLAEMGTRCGNLLDKAYKYDGGLIALCRQVRATL